MPARSGVGQADQAITKMLLPQYRPQAQQVRVVGVDRQASQLVTEAAARTRTQGVPTSNITRIIPAAFTPATIRPTSICKPK